MNFDDSGPIILMIIFLLPVVLMCLFMGLEKVEKAKKPKVIVVHVHKSSQSDCLLDGNDWKEIIDTAQEVT